MKIGKTVHTESAVVGAGVVVVVVVYTAVVMVVILVDDTGQVQRTHHADWTMQQPRM